MRRVILCLILLLAAWPVMAQQDTSYTTTRISPTPTGVVTAYVVRQGTLVLGTVRQQPAGRWTAYLPGGQALSPVYATLKVAAQRLVLEHNRPILPPTRLTGGLQYLTDTTYTGPWGCWYEAGSPPPASPCRTVEQALRLALSRPMIRRGTGAVVDTLRPASGLVTVVDTVRRYDTVTVHTTITLPPDTVKPPPVILPSDTVRTGMIDTTYHILLPGQLVAPPLDTIGVHLYDWQSRYGEYSTYQGTVFLGRLGVQGTGPDLTWYVYRKPPDGSGDMRRDCASYASQAIAMAALARGPNVLTFKRDSAWMRLDSTAGCLLFPGQTPGAAGPLKPIVWPELPRTVVPHRP